MSFIFVGVIVVMFFKSYIRLFVSIAGFGIILAVSASSTQAMEETDEQIHQRLLGKVVKLTESDVYVGAGFSRDNERLFFGMEKLDEKNHKTWEQYATDTKKAVRYFASFNNCLRRNQTQYFETVLQYNPEDKEFQNRLISLMQPQVKRLKTLLKGDGTVSGVISFEGMLVNLNDRKYVSYVSNKPIRGKYTPNSTSEGFTLKDFQKKYENIIMCFIVDGQSLDHTHHRGIFRNIVYEVDRCCLGISLITHGWAGWFAQQELEGKNHMVVIPTETMAKILKENIDPKNLDIDATACTMERTGIYKIKLEALAKFYLDSAEQK